jgi:hypothetical protein
MTTEGSDTPAQAARLAPTLRPLADRKIYFGTSSWKYDGWLGSIYSQDRYLTRGKLSNAKFEQECLAEYAEVFPTVCGETMEILFSMVSSYRRQRHDPFVDLRDVLGRLPGLPKERLAESLPDRWSPPTAGDAAAVPAESPPPHD